MRAVAMAAGLAVTTLLLASCGGDDEPEAPPEGIEFRIAQNVNAGTTREQLEEMLGTDPVLSSEPTELTPGGCVYYPLAGEPLRDVWVFCFDEPGGGVNFSASLRSATAPPAPEDASPAREVLIARADTICQSEYGHLSGITRDLRRALNDLGRNENEENRRAVAKEIAAFITNLEETHTRLAAFNAPDDESEVLTSYLEALESQIGVLEQARIALLEGDDTRYDELGDEFNSLASTARENAEQYGFATCGAATFR